MVQQSEEGIHPQLWSQVCDLQLKTATYQHIIIDGHRSRETLWSYSDRYWELNNEIRGDNEHVVASTFKQGLPLHSKLRDSLTM